MINQNAQYKRHIVELEQVKRNGSKWDNIFKAIKGKPVKANGKINWIWVVVNLGQLIAEWYFMRQQIKQALRHLNRR